MLRTRTQVHGGVVEMVVWRVPQPVPPSAHGFKYRLVFVREGQRLVGYDNERGKGDHKHLRDVQVNYTFVDIQPRNRSWTRPSGLQFGALARRDDAAGHLPARRSNVASVPKCGSIGCVARSPEW